MSSRGGKGGLFDVGGKSQECELVPSLPKAKRVSGPRLEVWEGVCGGAYVNENRFSQANGATGDSAVGSLPGG